MSALATWKEKVEEFNQKMEALKKDCGATFKDVIAAIFEANPTLKTIAWKQYTPSFNDGDPCTFRMNLDDLYLNGVNSYGDGDEEEDDGYECRGTIQPKEGESELAFGKSKTCGYYIDSDDLEDEDLKNCPRCGTPIPKEETGESEPLAENLYEDISEILASFDESVLVFLFTDNDLTVTLHRDGTVTKEEYDCGY